MLSGVFVNRMNVTLTSFLYLGSPVSWYVVIVNISSSDPCIYNALQVDFLPSEPPTSILGFRGKVLARKRI